MKIVLNKTGRDFIDTTELLQSIEDMGLLTHCKIIETKDYKRCIEYYCTNCGCQLQGTWANQYLLPRRENPCYNREQQDRDLQKINEMIEPFLRELRDLDWNIYSKEKDALARLTHCPVCGAELKREKGFFFSNVFSLFKDDKNYPDELKHEHDYDRYYHPGVIEEEENEVTQMAEQYASSCDIPIGTTLSSDNVENISTTPSKLKEYIQRLIELEMGIYSLTKRLKALYAQRVTSERNVLLSKCLPVYEKRTDVEVAEMRLQQWVEKVEQYQNGQIGIPLPQTPIPPVLATPSLFNKKKVLADNEILQQNYEVALANYESEMRQFELEKERLIANAEAEINKVKMAVEQAKEVLEEAKNREPSTVALAAKSVVDQEIEEAENLLKKLYECRNTLYSYNIVFDKYRNVVALSTFYEYLMAGRCTVLEGHEGAYNIYENEIRANMIIGQLTQVINKLDEIKDTQYMIYTELRSVNQSLDRLNETMDKALVSIQNMEKDIANISANTDLIAHNTTVSAYYSKVNAQLTNALGFMVALK